ncbi:MAG: bacterial transcriptional activator domain-containing protein [Bacteroidetes Order II. Incertae sedis bacterium]|nr:bacterial transcriptional activator domain-containing protein [Bacteroidetes Order II. bacterium]
MLSKSWRPELSVRTLGGFAVYAGETCLSPHIWKRDKSLQLFQYFLATKGIFRHREMITEALWPELSGEASERDFKVALNGIQQAFKNVVKSPVVVRSGVSYALDSRLVESDVVVFEQKIASGIQNVSAQREMAMALLREALILYEGPFLPGRAYEDWASEARERLHTLALSTMTTLAEIVLLDNATEALHLAQRVIDFEKGWEEAYRLAMRAYVILGNRPMALRTYEKCADVLADLYDVEPLPQTTRLYVEIKQL